MGQLSDSPQSFVLNSLQHRFPHQLGKLLEEFQRMLCWDQAISFTMDKQRGT
jgi:hypothetical protein